MGYLIKLRLYKSLEAQDQPVSCYRQLLVCPQKVITIEVGFDRSKDRSELVYEVMLMLIISVNSLI